MLIPIVISLTINRKIGISLSFLGILWGLLPASLLRKWWPVLSEIAGERKIAQLRFPKILIPVAMGIYGESQRRISNIHLYEYTGNLALFSRLLLSVRAPTQSSLQLSFRSSAASSATVISLVVGRVARVSPKATAHGLVAPGKTAGRCTRLRARGKRYLKPYFKSAQIYCFASRLIYGERP